MKKLNTYTKAKFFSAAFDVPDTGFPRNLLTKHYQAKKSFSTGGSNG
jgi:hypothetical protein